MATDDQAARPRDAEILLTDVRSVPKPALARLPPNRQTARKGCLNLLEVDSSHIGRVVNPDVLDVVARQLNLPANAFASAGN